MKLKKTVAIICCLALLLVFPVATNAENTQLTNLPSVYINLNDGVRQEEINKDDYVTGLFSIVGAGKYDMTDVALSIKGRGNSTWNLPKKPYALKFDKKQSLFGMEKAKKWVLLANYYDKTLMRNAVVQELADDMGMPFTIQYRFVDFFMNGIYRGNYILCEKVEIGSARVDVSETGGGALFEIEIAARHEAGQGSHDYCHDTPMGVHVNYKEPEWDAFIGDDEDENDPSVIAAAKERMKAMMAVNNKYLDDAEDSMSKGFEAYSQFIDVDSFVDWYIVNELTKNFDSGFITSVYCYRDVDGKLFMGPCWDYDTCLGNQKVLDGLSYEGLRVNNGAWYTVLLQDKDFMAALRERWTSLRSSGLIDTWLAKFATIKEEIKASSAKDVEVWPDAMALTELRGDLSVTYFTFEEEYNYLYNWTLNRIKWLDTIWNNNYLMGFNNLSAENTDGKLFTVVSASNPAAAEREAQYAFDGNQLTKTCLVQTWGDFTVVFKAQNAVKITRYGFTTANDTNGRDGDNYPTAIYQCRNPKKWKLSGSNDGVNFTDIDVRENINLGQHSFNSFEYRVSKPGEYVYYKLTVNDLWNRREANNIIQFAELLVKCDTTKIGDADLNDEINAVDALLALRSSIKLIELSAGGKYAADVDISGEITAEDSLKILRKSINLINSF